jgi:hypothetical protein
MYDEPEEPSAADLPRDPATRAREKSDEFRMHAELAAVFEAPRKFDAQIIPGLDANLARDIQRTMAKLDKSKSPDSPVLPPASVADAAALLNMPATRELPTGHYHVHRRPGEVMIVRWLAGEEVETFYERLQAHFDAALEGFREDERQARGWKNDPATTAYLAALDAIELKMADRYLRDPIRTHNLFVLSTQTADEININYLAQDVMGRATEELVGSASAPPEDAPTEQDLAWFFKLFALRGTREGVEQMCFFAFLQKSEESW